ncbi:Ribosomal RNA small subunit methyltransferase H [Candidatus Hodgkinia cicadicola]|nr:Ribosomal RNA small subunit methyltransferase H [Candidatus Hodgkinia cicadicola]
MNFVFCCLYYLNYKHLSSFVEETKLVLRANDSVLDCTYGTGGHSMILKREGCRVSATDCDVAALIYAAARAPFLSLKTKINLRNPTYDLIVIDTGISLAQAKQHWRRFSRDRGSPKSLIKINSNTNALFKRVANSLKLGGKLLLMVYSSEFALSAANLAQSFYLINRASLRPDCVERTFKRCASAAKLLVLLKIK